MTATREPSGANDGDAISVGELVALKSELTRQAHELAGLRALVLRMASELGIDAAAAPDAEA